MASELHMEFITQYNSTTPFNVYILFQRILVHVFYVDEMYSVDWNYNTIPYNSYNNKTITDVKNREKIEKTFDGFKR